MKKIRNHLQQLEADLTKKTCYIDRATVDNHFHELVKSFADKIEILEKEVQLLNKELLADKIPAPKAVEEPKGFFKK